MHEAVEDGVGERRVADDVVPFLDGELAGDDGLPDAVSVLEDFEQVVPVLGAERGEPPVVEHEDLGLGERFEQVRITTVGAGDGERAEQPGQREVERAVAVTADAAGERASDSALRPSPRLGRVGVYCVFARWGSTPMRARRARSGRQASKPQPAARVDRILFQDRLTGAYLS